jgi:hypothetical protein
LGIDILISRAGSSDLTINLWLHGSYASFLDEMWHPSRLPEGREPLEFWLKFVSSNQCLFVFPLLALLRLVSKTLFSLLFNWGEFKFNFWVENFVVDFCCFQAFRPVISWAGVRF